MDHFRNALIIAGTPGIGMCLEMGIISEDGDQSGGENLSFQEPGSGGLGNNGGWVFSSDLTAADQEEIAGVLALNGLSAPSPPPPPQTTNIDESSATLFQEPGSGGLGNNGGWVFSSDLTAADQEKIAGLLALNGIPAPTPQHPPCIKWVGVPPPCTECDSTSN